MNNQLKGEIIMNQDFIEGQTDLELVEVDSIVDSLSTDVYKRQALYLSGGNIRHSQKMDCYNAYQFEDHDKLHL